MTDEAHEAPACHGGAGSDRPLVMRRADGAALIATIGGLALWLGLSDGMLRYLRPSMRPWLVLAGAVLALLALSIAVSQLRDQQRLRRGAGSDAPNAGISGSHNARLGFVGWLVGLPLVISLGLAPGALGAYAIQRHQPFSASSVNFDLERHLRTHSFAGQAPELKLQEFLAAAASEDDRELLAATEVRLTGFVVGGHAGPGGFHLARLVIGCCAGDALTITVEVQGYEGVSLEDNTWIEVTGTFDPEASRDEEGSALSTAPVMGAASVRTVSAPSEPYEYPR